MSLILPRFFLALERIESERKIARILAETGDPGPTATVQRATLPGDTRRLRGIPCIARGVAGVSPGSDPTVVVRRSRDW